MVQIRSKRELAAMRKSGELTSRVLFELTKHVKPGVSLLELNNIAEELTLSFGAKPAFKGYLGFAHSLCTSVNEHVVHGIPSERKLAEGDVVGLDFGLVFNGFFGDSAVTVGVGKISDKARKLLQITKDSLYAAIDASREGNTLKDIAKAIEQTVKPHQYGIVREFVGHGIGTRLHEDPQVANYEAGASNLKLKAGMTIAIEPMVNEGTHRVRVLGDKWTVTTDDGGLSAHYEHTIAITDSEPEILTNWTMVLDEAKTTQDIEIIKKGAYGQRGSNPS
ncbi:MAG: type I methionyl aminopeptidase [Proteobacteria bacterium]|nr:type I methionyl aminopeptidase [Pseudomonadota bacterium]NDC24030.1 type I methionyl aminopeptidase [Pseudomonadota bacterium]NDD04038.1 type I methionyl aminopeptidase [Pseudomonadota bacterium]NDG26557.1 type I methionyl aminopeptidase [Pseudomonadota bacterium]